MQTNQNLDTGNPMQRHLSDKNYNTIKWVVQVALPVSASLYFGLSQIWGFPWAEQVVGTLALIASFLGAILGVSAKRYASSGSQYDGEITIEQDDDGKKIFTLSVDNDPNSLTEKKSVTFKIENQ